MARGWSLFVRLLVILGTFFGVLAIYGLFSFSYGFPQSIGEMSTVEGLLITKSFVWPNLLSGGNANSEYFFVFVMKTGQAYFGTGSGKDIATLLALNGLLHDSSMNTITPIWLFLQPVFAFIVIIWPYPKKTVSASVSTISSIPPAAPVMVPIDKKPLTAEEIALLKAKRKKRAIIGASISSIAVLAIVLGVSIPILIANEQDKAKASVSSFDTQARDAYVLGSPAVPIASLDVINDALTNHPTVDVHYRFSSSESIFSIVIPASCKDAYFINEGGSDKARVSFVYEQRSSGNGSRLALMNVFGSSVKAETPSDFRLDVYFSGKNSFVFTKEASACFQMRNTLISFSSLTSGSSLSIATSNGGKGKDGTNGANPSQDEGAINGTDGMQGNASSSGVLASGIVLDDSLRNAKLTVTTGDGGTGGNGGKAGWFIGFLGIGSHDGKPGKPGAGGKSGKALDLSDSKIYGSYFSGQVSSRGGYAKDGVSFISGTDGSYGSINS